MPTTESKMTGPERLAMVAALLSADENTEIREWIVIAHVHEYGKCDGTIGMAGNTDTEDSMMLLSAGMVEVLEGIGEDH